MIPLYQENLDAIQIREKDSNHFSPHLHKSIEIVYITKGQLELGIDTQLYHLDEGDLAIVFPDQIHHFQVFHPGKNRAIHLLAAPSYFGAYRELLITLQAKNPVIKKDFLDAEVLLALNKIMELAGENTTLHEGRKNLDNTSLSTNNVITPGQLNTKNTLLHSWIQILLSYTLQELTLIQRPNIHDYDLVYQTIAYVAEHFHEPLSLTSMAKDLGISQFTLSRVFSRTFHKNFNQYVNEIRLDYVTLLLKDSDTSVTEIMYDAGFQSQATFNRVFQEKYHMTPKQYRKLTHMA
ncbi:MAG: AraC family transcriptional regulator [Lachnospiraceae bacterium]|nr:AraC family transcriptional regulator [Lachnospiraceae bacterium]MDY5703384.1 AraC family transcriptional regulator [Lachnospiraceae bacterium]